MGLHVTGKCIGVTRENRGRPGETFQVVTVHLLDGIHTTRVELSKDFPPAQIPEDGEAVGFDVYVFAWKSKAGNVGYEVKAHTRNDDLLGALSLA